MHAPYRNDTLVIQIAVAMMILALVGIFLIRYQKTTPEPIQQPSAQPIKIAWEPGTDNVVVLGRDNPTATLPRIVENVNSDQVNVVKEYFRAIASEDFWTACGLLTKCNWNNETAVSLFSREFQKLQNGYEYVNTKDLWFKSPSGKDVICVKYSYRYKQDVVPELVSEVMSFYTSEIDGVIKITDRVCEKKYKEWDGSRPCPIEPSARYCVGNVK